MTATRVTVANFERAETDRMFAALQQLSGGVNRLDHRRGPDSLVDQTVIRQNRDTLYSSAIVDVSRGASLVLPDAGDRYLSMMVVNNDHYINRIFHSAGEYVLTTDEFDTPYVLIAARILVDPTDSADIAKVNALQDGMRLVATSSIPFESPKYDRESFDSTRDALLTLARGVPAYDLAFGRREKVDPVRHLLGTAGGWGGMPESEAIYLNVEPGLPVGAYALRVSSVPVDAFWSISVYNAQGFFEQVDDLPVSINSVTAVHDDDGSITVRFGTAEAPNVLGIMPRWNYIVRLYQPRAEILDGTWRFPRLAETSG